jgi:hypothetical protein
MERFHQIIRAIKGATLYSSFLLLSIFQLITASAIASQLQRFTGNVENSEGCVSITNA